MRSWFQHPVCQWGLSTIQGGCRGHGMRVTCCSSLRLSSSQMPKVPFAKSTDTRALPRAAGFPAPLTRSSAAGGAKCILLTGPCIPAHSLDTHNGWLETP